MLICKTCGLSRGVGRRECTDCAKKSSAARAKKHYQQNGHTEYVHKCCACEEVFYTQRKQSTLCATCREVGRATLLGSTYAYSSVGSGRSIWQHRVLAESLLGRRLTSNEVVHHVDFDRSNNAVENLLVLSRAVHASLHRFLEERIACLKRHDENPENCWKALIAGETTAWLETTGANVQKLAGLGNQQPSP